MTIGLPTIEIVFKKLAASIIARSQRGIVALIVKDDTQGDTSATVAEYKSVTSISSGLYTPENTQYIKDVLIGGAAKVIVACVPTASESVIADAIVVIGSRKFNWIGLADGNEGEQLELAAYAKEQEAAGKSIKAIVHKVTSPDSMHVVNFTNEAVTYSDGRTITGEKFVARLLGTLAGLPLTRSSTYIAFDDLSSVVEPADVNAAINNGEFVLFNDEETVRIGRGINSLKTFTATISEDFRKILIVETLDQIKEDIAKAFKDSYIGRYKNTYDNQILLISAINGYFATLAADGVLDSSFTNIADVDVDTQRNVWLAAGKTQAEDWDDQTVKNNPFGSHVFLAGYIKCPDAMEDFKFGVELQ